MEATFRERLQEATDQASEQTRSSIAHAVESLGGWEEISQERLKTILLDDEAELGLRAKAAWIVGLARESSLGQVLEHLASSEPPAQLMWEAAKALCTLGRGKEIYRSLLSISKAPETRQISAYALGLLSDSDAVSDLCRIVAESTEYPEVRGQAAESLGYLGSTDALPCLLAAAEDPNTKVRFWAIFALGQLKDRRAIPALEQKARSDHAIVEGWWEVSKEARAALEEIRSSPRSGES